MLRTIADSHVSDMSDPTNTTNGMTKTSVGRTTMTSVPSEYPPMRLPDRHRNIPSKRCKSWPANKSDFSRIAEFCQDMVMPTVNTSLMSCIEKSVPSMCVLEPWIHEPSNSSDPLAVPPDSLVTRPSPLPNSVPPLEEPTSWTDFADVIASVREAIKAGIHPILIAKGSSGSYFCRNIHGEIVGVFKPKDEEPYGHLNPKWIKWIHRNLFPCCFGRSCIIPNLGYISEAAASYVDRRLNMNIVPRTEVVKLASSAFFYPWKDRWAHQVQGKPLPDKVGSFQIFVSRCKDATSFFREGYQKISLQRGLVSGTDSGSSSQPALCPVHPLGWTTVQQSQFRFGFERMVILDYMIRNTDRSSDNWLVRWPEVSSNIRSNHQEDSISRNSITAEDTRLLPSSDMREGGDTSSINHNYDSVRIVAIDHGLAFPTHHPTRVRSYPYGWSFLSHAKTPFSVETATWVLPYLTSPTWLEETLDGLESLFALDPDFKASMWIKQKSLIRGQVYNLTLVLSSVLRSSRNHNLQCQILRHLSSSQQIDTDRVVTLEEENAEQSPLDPHSLIMSPYDLVQRPLVIIHEEPVQQHPLSLFLESSTPSTPSPFDERPHTSLSPSPSASTMWTNNQPPPDYISLERHSHKPSFLSKQKRKLRKMKHKIETLTGRAFFSNW